MSDHLDPWPWRHLVLRTPRLELRPDDDAGLLELAELARQGVHGPDEMPFPVPWTQVDEAEIGPNTLRHHWAERAACVNGDLRVQFLVRLNGTVIGVQSLRAQDFPVTGEISTGSWVGLKYQGQGFGTEMRAAVVMFAFDHLGATQARSSAFTDNAASHGVSRKIGYRPDGTELFSVRGQRRTDVRLLLKPEWFVRPEWRLETEGVAGCLRMVTPFHASGQEPTNAS